MGECNTVLSAYTMYRHLEQYYTLPLLFTLYQTIPGYTDSGEKGIEKYGEKRRKRL